MNNSGANRDAGLQFAYPGEYRPPVYSKEEQLSTESDPSVADPLTSAQIIELPDHYEVEVSAPGHRHDDFIITTDSGMLHITALNNNGSGAVAQMPVSARSVYFDVMLTLPSNVDSDFVRAEYKAGILNICFRKAEKAVRNLLHSIIVY